MRRRALVVALLLACSLAAIAVDAQLINDEPTRLKESQCYNCHSTGGGNLGPPLPLLYILHGPTDLELQLDEPKSLEIGIENAWVSELRDIFGVANLTAAPCIGFATDKEPVLDVIPGVVEDAASSTEERRDRHTVTVESGASDLIISLSPSGPTDATMRLDIWTPGKDPDASNPNFVEQSPDDSGSYVFKVHGAETITSLGVGEWTVDVVVPSATENPQNAGDQPYVLDVSQDFRVSGESEQFTGTPDVLVSRVEEPYRLAYLDWLITASCIPDGPSVITADVFLVAHYDHASSITQYDDWLFVKTIELQVVPEGDTVHVQSVVAGPPPLVDAFAWDVLSEIVGYLSAILILASIYTGGMFGKASRRQLNTVFGNAKRRVAFHNFLSYGILLAAVAHTIIFLVESGYHWTLGIIWGGIAIFAMIGLGVTGALQVPMIRKWNYAVWRWSHFYLSIGTIVFTIVHIFLDGVHFADFQETLGWSNPLDRG